MPSITLDAQRWQTFSQLLTATAYQNPQDLLDSFLQRLIEFWPAQAGALLYIDPLNVPFSLEHGELPADGHEMIEQARSVFERTTGGEQDLGVYGINDELALVELTLRSGDDEVGLLHLIVSADRVSPENEGELALLLVGVAGGAADRVALLNTTRSELDEMNLLYQVSQSIASDIDLRSLLRTIIEKVTQIVDSESASLLLVDEVHKELYFETPSNNSQELRSYRMPMDQGFAGWVVTHGQGLIVDDPQNDARFYRQVDSDISHQTRNILTVPVRSRERTVGVIQAVNKRNGPFTEHDLRTLSMLANQAAISIENANLYTKLKEERDRLIRKEEEVRHQINRDLHDGPTQSVAAIAMNIEFIKKLMQAMPERVEDELNSLAALVKKTYQELRTLLFELRPLGLETQGLVATLHEYANKFRDPSGMQVRFTPGNFIGRLAPQTAAATFMIIQEAVNNARKHAKASMVWIELFQDSERQMLTAVVRDSGIGFDLKSITTSYEERGSFGLLNMGERATLAGGACEIRSSAGEGTQIIIRVPTLVEEAEDFA
ncbi:MAG TPA: histidine kinase [Herpetosiphon sp.]|uniref:GAF sensor signal transduction histidine kinase n=1 Tax=Herpetosiphon aurantiacus (strain ATCC 23779 / DSM 785 / 114-95) TaxID=316274 RepID=A9B7C8_HERA2|nr:GAF domain-containing sensor histidine kinase [Herpetosiphon sp.]ABX06411.1 GAF sensor signal transduction histidine kinase [Herpetosiphon aurantiacus DSM 785]HBW49846.1 histidine kinase [Herpetosiphon sp.]